MLDGRGWLERALLLLLQSRHLSLIYLLAKMTELNDLFEQIFHSEMHFKARIDHLKKVKIKIDDCQLKLEQTQELLHTKQGELAVKNSKLANIEMEVKLLQLRKEILQSQKNDITEENKKLREEYQSVIDESAKQQQLFKEQLKEFSRCYDLHGSGSRYREEEDKKRLASLQDELILLETEIVEIETYQEDMEKLTTELRDMEEQLKLESDKEKELKDQLLDQEALISKLREEKACSSTNPELKRLQLELDACKNCPEEEACKELTKELERLQKECYHKQMKLQVARQSKSNPSAASKRSSHYSNHQQTPQSEFTEDDFSQELDNLVEEEWYEAGDLQDFDSDDGGMEDDWDVDVTELEQSLALVDTSKNSTTIGRQERKSASFTQKKFPPSNFNAVVKSEVCSRSMNEATRSDFQSASMLEPRMSGRAEAAVATNASTKRLSSFSSSSLHSNNDHKTGKSSIRSDLLNISNNKKAKKVRFHY